MRNILYIKKDIQGPLYKRGVDLRQYLLENLNHFRIGQKKFFWPMVMMMMLFFNFNKLLYAKKKSFVDGEGHFFTQEGDGQSFLKKQLLYSSFRDVLTKEMKNLKLDATNFWIQYDKHFNDHFTQVKENLLKKFYEKNKDQTKLQLKQLRKNIRIREKTARAKFGNIGQAIGQYSIKQMKRISASSSVYYIKIQAKVNQKILNNIYLKFTETNENRVFKKLYLDLNFSIGKMHWKNIGVKDGDHAKTLIVNYWKREILRYTENLVDEVAFVDSFIKENLNKYSEMFFKNYNTYGNVGKGITAFEESEFSSSLLIKVKIRIAKSYDLPFFNKSMYKIYGNYILVDLGTNKVVDTMDFPVIEKSFNTALSLGSNVISYISSLPIKKIRGLFKTLSKIPPTKDHIVLDVSPYYNINNVLIFLKLLTNKGVRYRLNAEIYNYSINNVKIILEYLASLEDIKKMILRLRGRELSPDLTFQIYDLKDLFKVGFKKRDMGEHKIEEAQRSESF